MKIFSINKGFEKGIQITEESPYDDEVAEELTLEEYKQDIRDEYSQQFILSYQLTEEELAKVVEEGQEKLGK